MEHANEALTILKTYATIPNENEVLEKLEDEFHNAESVGHLLSSRDREALKEIGLKGRTIACILAKHPDEDMHASSSSSQRHSSVNLNDSVSSQDSSQDPVLDDISGKVCVKGSFWEAKKNVPTIGMWPVEIPVLSEQLDAGLRGSKATAYIHDAVKENWPFYMDMFDKVGDASTQVYKDIFFNIGLTWYKKYPNIGTIDAESKRTAPWELCAAANGNDQPANKISRSGDGHDSLSAASNEEEAQTENDLLSGIRTAIAVELAKGAACDGNVLSEHVTAFVEKLDVFVANPNNYSVKAFLDRYPFFRRGDLVIVALSARRNIPVKMLYAKCTSVLDQLAVLFMDCSAGTDIKPWIGLQAIIAADTAMGAKKAESRGVLTSVLPTKLEKITISKIGSPRLFAVCSSKEIHSIKIMGFGYELTFINKISSKEELIEGILCLLAWYFLLDLSYSGVENVGPYKNILQLLSETVLDFCHDSDDQSESLKRLRDKIDTDIELDL